MKLFDEYGLPLDDGYNYQQHLAVNFNHNFIILKKSLLIAILQKPFDGELVFKIDVEKAPRV